MVRWKLSLGLGTGESISDANDPRKCIIKSLAMVGYNDVFQSYTRAD